MQIIRTIVACIIIGNINHTLCGPENLVPAGFAVASGYTVDIEVPVQKIDCSTPQSIADGIKNRMFTPPASPVVQVLPALPSIPSAILPAASGSSLVNSSAQATSSGDSPFAVCYPFAPLIMLNWGSDVASTMMMVAKTDPKASGTVFNLYKIICRIGIQPFLNIFKQAQPVGLQLYAQAQQNPAVQEMAAQIKKLVHERAPLKTRVAALALQTAINNVVRQEIIKQSLPTFSPGASIMETIRLNKGKTFGMDGQALLAGNIYASIGDMSDQQKADPHAFYAYQQIIQSVLPL
jgi:hypothetical protein